MFKLIEAMSQDLSITQGDLLRILATAPHRYKVFAIKKRNGKGMREVAQPAYELKVVQRWLVDNVFTGLPLHDAALAYRKGVNIRCNASIHSGMRFVLKMDFTNFFPSIRESDIRSHLQKHLSDSYSVEDLDAITRLVIWSPKKRPSRCLCIGAPSSPILSNSVMYDFDCKVAEYCKNKAVKYSRYADDLTFSTNKPNILSQVERYISKEIENISVPRLNINESKTVYTSKKKRIQVTGLVLTPSGEVSLGRQRKRTISAKIHNFALGRMGQEEILELKGLLAFAKDVEPDFIKRMKKKYGDAVLEKIFKYIK